MFCEKIRVRAAFHCLNKKLPLNICDTRALYLAYFLNTDLHLYAYCDYLIIYSVLENKLNIIHLTDDFKNF